ncbi:AbrB/MazE/SpoVT family DNA-binding domain-containing protein [Virgibacillus dokdonensis]|nr:AbrB/MazE/SpoVT family DNA-binding domain-containing protein [Virgibacillus dokdonensis]AUJ23821.1 SpoVT / AbrB like domain protein [Virgibacillus dokdonensis]NWO12563.1 AbrB/MazE/SpoVT family DNA-binding domain-containing protein [Virgibacillus sp.]SHH97992.1 putative addiction module antidote [Virgibacillus chiguensis]
MEKETRKVSKLGNSLGVGIPKSMVDALNIRRGDELEFEVKENALVIKRKEKLEDQLEPEFLRMIQETMEEHDELFKRLK